VLSRREATLRGVATVCLAGVALMQAIGLPPLLVHGGRFVVLSLAAMAACLVLGVALAVVPASASRAVWRLVAATGVVVLAGWALPRAYAVPGLETARGHWTALPGAVCAALAVGGLLAGGLAGRPRLPSARALATALAVLAAFGPGVWVVLVALGPGVVGGEKTLAAGHVHGQAHSAQFGEAAIKFRAGSGREGGRYVVAVQAPARRGPGELVLVVAMTMLFTSSTVGRLRSRSAPVARLGLGGEPA
jgi:hypothetical protein